MATKLSHAAQRMIDLDMAEPHARQIAELLGIGLDIAEDDAIENRLAIIRGLDRAAHVELLRLTEGRWYSDRNRYQCLLAALLDEISALKTREMDIPEMTLVTQVLTDIGVERAAVLN